MLKRTLAITAMACAALAGGTLAQAAIKRHVRQTIKQSAIAESATYPSPGSSALSAGILTGTIGNGAMVQNIRITGHPTPTTYTFKGTNRSFYAHGTITSSLSGTATANPDGSVSLAGHGHYTGGTDAYRGARGKYSFRGTIPPPIPNRPSPLVAHVIGTLTY